jgi:hypothetical protein
VKEPDSGVIRYLKFSTNGAMTSHISHRYCMLAYLDGLINKVCARSEGFISRDCLSGSRHLKRCHVP